LTRPSKDTSFPRNLSVCHQVRKVLSTSGHTNIIVKQVGETKKVGSGGRISLQPDTVRLRKISAHFGKDSKEQRITLYENGKIKTILVIDPTKKAEIINEIGKKLFNDSIELIKALVPSYIEAASEMGFVIPEIHTIILETKESISKIETGIAGGFDDKTMTTHMDLVNFLHLTHTDEEQPEVTELQKLFVNTCHEFTHWLASKPGRGVHPWKLGSLSEEEFEKVYLSLKKHKTVDPDLLESYMRNSYGDLLLEGTTQILTTDIALRMFSKKNLADFKDVNQLKDAMSRIQGSKQAYAAILAFAVGKEILVESYTKADFSIIQKEFFRLYSLPEAKFYDVISVFYKLCKFVVKEKGIYKVLTYVDSEDFPGRNAPRRFLGRMTDAFYSAIS